MKLFVIQEKVESWWTRFAELLKQRDLIYQKKD
jgi:hypothetical protein